MPEHIDYITFKIPLKKIVRNPRTESKLFETVERVNILNIHLYQFLRLWTLSYFEEGKPMPIITENTVKMAFRALLNNEKRPGRRPTTENQIIQDEFEQFYNDHYKFLGLPNKLHGSNLSSIIDYSVTVVVTDIENNIRAHFPKYVKRYVNGVFQSENHTHNEAKHLKKELHQVKRDLLENRTPLGSDAKYHTWIEEKRKYILPEACEHNHYYSCKKNPQNYLAGMFRMTKELETLKRKMFQPFPLRTSLIPRYVAFDTHALIDLLVDKESGLYEKDKNDLYKNLLERKNMIWNKYFRMDHNIFKSNGWRFDYRIVTDGFAVSLQFVKAEHLEKKNLRKIKMSEGTKRASKARALGLKYEKSQTKELVSSIVENKTNKDNLPYLEDLDTEKLKELREDGFVVCDPGRNHLLYMMDDSGNRLKFSNKEKMKKTGELDCRTRLLKFRKDNVLIEFEKPLSGVSKKSCNFEGFKNYIRVRNIVNQNIGRVYCNTIFRRLKWYTFVEKKRYFDNMLKQIKSTFGKKNILYGDFEGKCALKGTCPTPGIGLKRRISRELEIYNLDEFRTSKLNWKTEDEGNNLRVRDSTGKKVRKIHSILTFKTEQGSDGCIGRDLNAVRNMLKIVNSWLIDGVRPHRYCRGVDLVKSDVGPQEDRLLQI